MKFRTLMLLATTLLAAPAIARDVPTPAAAVPRQDEIKAQNPLAAREQALAPVLSWMQSLGIKLTYLGDEGGLSGYLAEDATGKMQTIYVTPDRQHVVAGLLLKRGGDNITGVQVGEMRERFARAAEQYVPKDGISDELVSSPPNDAAAEPASSEPVTPEVMKTDSEKPEEQASVPTPEVADEAAALALPVASGPIAGAAGNPAELWISKIDQEKFLKAAAEVPYFEVGSRSAPITLYEIADPQCPYCHAAWDDIKQLVFDKKVKLRVILIAALNGSEPKVRDILASGVPARRWIDSDGGKNLKLEVDPNSQPFKDSASFLEENMKFARDFGVDRTPFLGYVGYDGKFYSALGLPSDLRAFLSAAVAR